MTHKSPETLQAHTSLSDLHYESIRPLLYQDGAETEAIGKIIAFLRDFPEYGEAHNDLAVLYYRTGDFDGTLAHYEKAVLLSPDNITFKKNLASFLFVQCQRRDEAIELYANILSSNPHDVETLIALGIISRSMGLLKEARLFFCQALEQEPWNTEAATGLELVVADLLQPVAQDGNRTTPKNAHTANVPEEAVNLGQEGAESADRPPTSSEFPVPGTIVWIAPFYNRSGFGVGARTNVLALHRAGANIRIVSVDQIEEGIDDCDMDLLKSLENTPIIPPITAIISHVPNKAWLDLHLPEPSVRILATTAFDCCAEDGAPPQEMLDVCRKMDQIWLHVYREREAFLAAGFSPEKVHTIYWPHHWVENPALPPATPEHEQMDNPFRFLNISLFLPRRRWDTLIEAYLSEFTSSDNVELYLKVNYPSWHPVPGKPKQDLLDLIAALRQKTGSAAKIILDEEIGTRSGILQLIDSCNAYVSTDTAATSPVSEARVRKRLVILPTGLLDLTEESCVPIPVDPQATVPISSDMLQYQPNHKGSSMPLLHVHDVRQALRQAYDMPIQERIDRAEKASYLFGPSETLPVMVAAIHAAWQNKNSEPARPTCLTTLMRIVWEGPQFAQHSLALVNRELCLRLMESEYEVGIIPRGDDQCSTSEAPRFKKLLQGISRTLSGPVDIHIRHQWPPDFTPPKEGHWINIQPWEYGSLPQEWLVPMTTQIDEMWVPTSFVRDCYLRSGVPAESVHVVPNGVDTTRFNPDAAPVLLDTTKSFRFLFVGGTIYRKGIDILLKAYCATFSDHDDVCLIIKDMGGDTFYKGQTARQLIEQYQSKPNAPEIRYLDHYMDDQELAGLYTACNCLVHPYRGEGFGLPIAEAMACGIPAIVTGYGAALDFCTGHTGWLIPAKTVELSDKKIGPLTTVNLPWLAEADFNELCRALHYAATHPAETRSRGVHASRHISAHFSWDRAAEKMFERLSALQKQPILRCSPPAQVQQDSISIIVRAGGARSATLHCVESIKRHTTAPFELFVFNDSDQGEPVEWLAATLPGIKPIEGLWGTPACNEAIRNASYKYICILSDEVTVTQEWHTGLIECLQLQPDAGIVAPMGSQAEGIQQVKEPVRENPAEILAFTETFRNNNRHRRLPSRQLDRFCVLFRKELPHEIGFLDPEMGLAGAEIADFCLRSALAGHVNCVASDVFVHRSPLNTECDACHEQTRCFREKWSRPLRDHNESRKAMALKTLEQFDSYRRRGEYDAAVTLMLDQGIPTAPNDRRFYQSLADLFLEREQFQNALDTLRETPPETSDEAFLVYLGKALAGLGNAKEAVRYAEEALALRREFSPALHLLGTIAYCANDAAAAEAFWLRSVQADPGNGSPLAGLGLLAWNSADQERAIRLMAQGFRLSPLATEIQQAAHTLICETGRYALGEALFREAHQIYPDHRGIHFLLIDLLIRQNRVADALDQIEAACAQFGFDGQMLAAGLQLRETLGPLAICKEKAATGTSVSLCMIIKNEAQNLARCLANLKPIVDEIIIVDTGSTDESVALAEMFGARVFTWEWTGDFAAARNESLQHASGNWILVMDADELIAPQDYERFRKTIADASTGKTAYMVETRNYSTSAVLENWRLNDGSYAEESGAGWVPSRKIRLFPNIRTIHFQGAIHELVTKSVQAAGIPCAELAVPVHHYGYLDKERQERKKEDYYQLGKRKLEESHDRDFDALCELALQASATGRYEEALSHFDQALTLNPFHATVHFNRGFALMQTGKYHEARKASLRALELHPGHIDATVNLATCTLLLGDAPAAAEILHDTVTRNPDHFFSQLIYALCLLCHGHEHQAQEILARLNRKNIAYDAFVAELADNLTQAEQNHYASKLRATVKPMQPSAGL